MVHDANIYVLILGFPETRHNFEIVRLTKLLQPGQENDCCCYRQRQYWNCNDCHSFCLILSFSLYYKQVLEIAQQFRISFRVFKMFLMYLKLADKFKNICLNAQIIRFCAYSWFFQISKPNFKGSAQFLDLCPIFRKHASLQNWSIDLLIPTRFHILLCCPVGKISLSYLSSNVAVIVILELNRDRKSSLAAISNFNFFQKLLRKCFINSEMLTKMCSNAVPL